jgi:hypothetical protein
MGSFSNYWVNEILDHLFGKGTYTPPTIYVGLSTAEPLKDASALAEPVGANYSRVETSASDWNIASSGIINNAVAVTFSQASGSWGTPTHFVLFDALIGGNMLCYGSLSAPESISTGNIPEFAINNLSVTLS